MIVDRPDLFSSGQACDGRWLRIMSIQKTNLTENERLQAEYLREESADWKRWGPYLSERQWGTVREDYSADGTPWDSFPHDDARSRTYRWGEDGLLGITDRQCRLCFALALWNGRDPILKERLFGVSGTEGNHGEDVKEEYYYLESTPTHAYMKALYKYPQREYPYSQLVAENRERGRELPEMELADTGVFASRRCFDVFVEYAKAAPDDMLIRIRIHNLGPKSAELQVLPQLWFRNTWSWGSGFEKDVPKPVLRQVSERQILAEHATLGDFTLTAGPGPSGKRPEWLFTDNESAPEFLPPTVESSGYSKDAFHHYVVGGRKDAVNPERRGTKAAARYKLRIQAGATVELRLRLSSTESGGSEVVGAAWESCFAERIAECEDFYGRVIPKDLSTEEQRLLRQAYAGLIWSKQFYHYVVTDWLDGDTATGAPPESRRELRNADWPHLFNRDVIAMPDKWEYPWYAAWDLAFHVVTFADVDPWFAKDQLLLFLREWYMHPNGQIPAYEWNFSDVNPPVHAWACWRVYRESAAPGERDRLFLSRCFQKLLLNFTWWVNRKDLLGKHVFSGGFLGLDNIGVFDRSRPLPTGGHLHQADATAWMGFFCARMLTIALELASENPAYADMASKFFEHYIEIADAMNSLGSMGLWDEQDGFYYDHLYHDGQSMPLRVRSMVGLIPLFTSVILSDAVLEKLPGFRQRTEWFIRHRADRISNITFLQKSVDSSGRSGGGVRLLAIPTRERMERMLRYLLDENEFLSPWGIRSLSRVHEDHPFVLEMDGEEHGIGYVPGDSDSGMFGGNSNWRGPVWFPLNYLLIESLERYGEFYGEDFRVECPVGSGVWMTLCEVAEELMRRQVSLFIPDESGERPCHGGDLRYRDDPAWKDLILFYEYFHGETGRGLGASHQTGWTALVAKLVQRLHREDDARHRRHH